MGDLDLLPGVSEDIVRAAYQNAPGNEIESGKFANPESSAALVANTFGFFVDTPSRLSVLPGCEDCGWPANLVKPEVIVRFPWNGGHHPCLDVLVVTSNCLIGIESKRYEPFRSKQPPQFSQAYWRPVWGQHMAGYERCRDMLRDNTGMFSRLDAAQLIKHAFGLRSAVRPDGKWPGKRPVLFYVYVEPTNWPDGRVISFAERVYHRAEIEEFSNLVAGDEVAFRSCSYSTLLSCWTCCGDQAIGDHAEAVAARFSL